MTPLILLVGFLGAGKTTYLRHLLPELRARGIDPHVIINDYQNARVDAELLRELTDSIVPISGSCVCCGSREELLGALEKFDHAPHRVVVIETNGTTDAGELVELLALDPAVARFTQPVQLSVIDGQRWQKRFWNNALELEQTRTAGFLFVSRWPDLDAARRAKVDASLAHHDLLAPRLDPAAFAREIEAVVAAVSHVTTRDAVAHPGCDCGPDHDGEHGTSPDHGHHHDDEETHSPAAHHFASLQVDLPATVPRRALAAFLDGLPREVIRVKGLARLAESPEEFHVFQRVEDGPTQWLPIGKTPRLSQPVAVLIGPAIDPGPIHDRAAALFGGAPVS